MARPKILLVEDNKAQAAVTREFLEKNGHEVLWAGDGKSAIKAAKSNPVDVVILDLVLPDMNGNTVCRWLKMDNDTRGVPIIMLTSADSLTSKVEGLEAGADDYLPKPYNEVELNARIYASLRTKALQDELREKNKALENLLSRVEILAITDPLTGLYNRRHFEKVFEREATRASRYRNSRFSCMMLDIDLFKSVNDQFGHKAGDAVLVEIARLLKKHLREVDTVSRWGGEEFVALMPQTGPEDAMAAATRIKEGIAGAVFTEAPGRKVTVSIGIATGGHETVNAEKLIDAADTALYQAKRNGRNRIELAA